MLSYYFTIIGTNDNPLYELEFSLFKFTSLSGQTGQTPGKSQFEPSVKELLPYITHASLDVVDDATWTTNQFNLGRIDLFYGISVNAFLTQGNIKFLLCHTPNTGPSGSLGAGTGSVVSSSTSSKNEDNAIRQFFMEINELYVKCLMNPLYSVNEPIRSTEFDLKVKLLARKYL